jgi:hypothetical protein
MTDRYDVVSTTRFTLTALSLLLIVLSVLAPVTTASTPVVFAVSADRGAETHLDTLDLSDDLVPPINAVRTAWLPVVSSLTLTAVIEWAWSLTPPVRPPSFSL